MDKTEKGEEHIKHAVRGFSATLMQYQEVPVPVVVVENAVEQNEENGKVWKIPNALIKCEEPLKEMYDLEEDDERFLRTFQEGSLTPGMFESLIDKLERLTGYQEDYFNVVPIEKVKVEVKDVPPKILEAVYGYWVAKRFRLGKVRNFFFSLIYFFFCNIFKYFLMVSCKGIISSFCDASKLV